MQDGWPGVTQRVREDVLLQAIGKGVNAFDVQKGKAKANGYERFTNLLLLFPRGTILFVE